MISPMSPHFGWLWVAVVRSVKFHSQPAFGNTNLTAMLNSNPLVEIYINNSAHNINVLTISHILTGDVITSPVGPLEEKKIAITVSLGYCTKFEIMFLENVGNWVFCVHCKIKKWVYILKILN